ncbi:hypothetical protein TBR22_A36380 [Luteitalea sp. TBR-22]|uniref:hypothetical protein n=1 Tax=Luteitalea sp. TBR-22 TaxID=2802971 RepID=UPI001AF6920E|nr:hypothetical protein [Luteitalea sp. TBR-22]BCS34411.1 hypothetical protein TBR22_A36380 [Luteitalea sp. TBR-22]
MILQLRGRRPATSTGVSARLDVGASTLTCGRETAHLPLRATALLALLAVRRLDADRTSPESGWVTLSDISGLHEWHGGQSTASLASQVRREVKRIHLACPGIVEAPCRSQLRGPFRLAARPTIDTETARALARRFEVANATRTASSAEDVYGWMESAEPVWRTMHYHDKPGEALSNVPPVDAVPASDPLLTAMALLLTAKRLRDTGALDLAERTAHEAEEAAANIPPPIVHSLRGQATLQRAWVAYRRGHLDDAERLVSTVMATASDFGFLRLQGQALNLRSLIWRTRGMYPDSLRDLLHAARLFVVEGDLQHLFAVYHNLACVVSVEAMAETDDSRRRARLRVALAYSQRHESYCHRYAIGRNSVLNKLLQIGLLRQLGERDAALRLADDAEAVALESQNFPDAQTAHRHRLAILLESSRRDEAAAVHAETLGAIESPAVRRQFARIYREERARV